jgi:oxalate---CoA ligase
MQLLKSVADGSGEKIAPVEVDGILLSHEAVGEAVSFAVPDDMYGQEIHAAVVLKAGKEVSEKGLMEYVGSKLAKFKVPKKVTLRKDIADSADLFH